MTDANDSRVSAATRLMAVRGRRSARADPVPKIFVIGFSKCGTTSLHEFFLGNGIPSRHHGSNDVRKNLALSMLRNISVGRNILHGIDGWTAYADINYASETLYVEACCFFREMHRDYPDAYFILPQRNVEDWIRSRLRHGGGSFAARVAASLCCTADDLPGLWRRQYDQHVAEVHVHFRDRPGSRLLELELGANNGEALAAFLMPDFEVDPTLWRRANATRSLPGGT
jgi:hypothetical protein